METNKKVNMEVSNAMQKLLNAVMDSDYNPTEGINYIHDVNRRIGEVELALEEVKHVLTKYRLNDW